MRKLADWPQDDTTAVITELLSITRRKQLTLTVAMTAGGNKEILSKTVLITA